MDLPPSPLSSDGSSQPDDVAPLPGEPRRGNAQLPSAAALAARAAAADPLVLGAAGAILAFAAGYLRLSLLWVAAALALVVSVRARAQQRAAALADAAPPPFLPATTGAALPDAHVVDDVDAASSDSLLPEWLAYSDVERCAWVNLLADTAYAHGGRALLETRLAAALCRSLAAHTIPIPGLPLRLVATVVAVSLGDRTPLEVVAVKAVRPPPPPAAAVSSAGGSANAAAAGGGELHLDVSWRLVAPGANITISVKLSRREDGDGREEAGGGGACPADAGRGAAARGTRRAAPAASDADAAGSASVGGGLRAVADALLAAPSLTVVVRNATASGQLRLAAAPLVGVPPFAGALRLSLLRLPVVDFDLDAPQPLNVMALPPVAAALTAFLKVRRHECSWATTGLAQQQLDGGTTTHTLCTVRTLATRSAPSPAAPRVPRTAVPACRDLRPAAARPPGGGGGDRRRPPRAASAGGAAAAAAGRR